MTIRILKLMFDPASIAIISRDRQDSALAVLLERNLLEGGFKGPVLPVNPHCHSVAGVLAYRKVASLPETPELAISTLPLAESPAPRRNQARIPTTSQLSGMGSHPFRPSGT